MWTGVNHWASCFLTTKNKDMKDTYTLADVKKAIEMARMLEDGKNEFEVENILGSSDGTYGIEVKYTISEIIKALN